MTLARLPLLVLALLAAFVGPAGAAYECYSQPNASASSAFPKQARLWGQGFQIITEAIMQTGVVYSAGGCLVTAQGTPNMTVAVAGCTVAQHGTTATVTGANVTIAAAHASLPRIDYVSANNVGGLVATTGTAAASPEPPTLPQSGGFNNILLAEIQVPANDVAINSNQIVDKRACIPTPGAGGGAPTTIGAWTKTAEAGLSNEQNMGSLATGLIINTTTTGVPTIYAGAACTNQFIEDLSASGAPTCTTSTLAGPQHANQGTTTTVLHGNAAGNPSFGAVSLTADVSGDLPYANLTPATAASKLLGRGSAGGAGDWQEITLGSGLTMTATTLSAPTGGSGTVTHTVGALTADRIVIGNGTDDVEVSAATLTAAGVATVGDTASTGSSAGGLNVTASAAPAAFAEVKGSATTTAVAGARLQHTTSGAMANGFGVALDFMVRDTDAVNNTLATVTATRTGADNTGTLEIATANAGTLGARLSISGAGVIVPGLASAGTQCVQASSAGLLSVTGSACGGGGGFTETLAVVTSDVVHTTSNTTLSDITGLVLAISSAATEKWSFECKLLAESNGTAADFKWGWATVPAGATIRWAIRLATASTVLTEASTETSIGLSGIVVHTVLGVINGGGTAGNVQLQFAQDVSSANTTNIKAGSNCRFTKVIS